VSDKTVSAGVVSVRWWMCVAWRGRCWCGD